MRAYLAPLVLLFGCGGSTDSGAAVGTGGSGTGIAGGAGATGGRSHITVATGGSAGRLRATIFLRRQYLLRRGQLLRYDYGRRNLAGYKSCLQPTARAIVRPFPRAARKRPIALAFNPAACSLAQPPTARSL